MNKYLLDTSALAAYLQQREPAVSLLQQHEVTTSIIVYADIRRKLRPPYGKGLIGDMDTLIVATALERNLMIITTDSDFERVPYLKTKLVNLRAA